MKERPVLFTGEMVLRVLDGTKTQTRRVVKPQPIPQHSLAWAQDSYIGRRGAFEVQTHYATCVDRIKCPYGQPGDHLWVRETWRPREPGRGRRYISLIEYRAGGKPLIVPALDGIDPKWDDREKWRPSIFMPRWASRIDLEMLSVRVERVQEISEEDALAEGICSWCDRSGILYEGTETDPREMCGGHGGYGCEDPCDIFRGLWDSINAKRGFGWDMNPWVWVVDFKRIKP